MLPNIIDEYGLRVHSEKLYRTLLKIGKGKETLILSLNELAILSNMSRTAVYNSKIQLEEVGLIQVEKKTSARDKDIITILPIWDINNEFFDEKSRPQIPGNEALGCSFEEQPNNLVVQEKNSQEPVYKEYNTKILKPIQKTETSQGSVSSKVVKVKEHSFPEDWDISQQLRNYITTKFPQLTESQIQRYKEDFADYWIEKPSVKRAGWDGTFRRYLRDQMDRVSQIKTTQASKYDDGLESKVPLNPRKNGRPFNVCETCEALALDPGYTGSGKCPWHPIPHLLNG